jgi:hypothetical protein
VRADRKLGGEPCLADPRLAADAGDPHRAARGVPPRRLQAGERLAAADELAGGPERRGEGRVRRARPGGQGRGAPAADLLHELARLGGGNDAQVAP